MLDEVPRSRGKRGAPSPSLGEYAGSSESTIILWRGGGQTYIGHIYPDSDKMVPEGCTAAHSLVLLVPN